MDEEETTIHAADSLARMIFVEAHPSTSMQISLPSLQCVKELFFLLLDLFIRGLLMLYAKPAESRGQQGIAVHDITAEQFETLSSKLLVAGIQCRRSVVEDPSVKKAETNIDDLLCAENNLPLEEYRLRVTTRGVSYTMWFKIVHNVRPGELNCYGNVMFR